MRTILFDVDGVLIHGFHADEGKRRRWDVHLREDLGIEPEELKPFFADEFPRNVITGRLSLVEALDRFLPTIGNQGATLALVSYWLARDSQLNIPLLGLIRSLRAGGSVRLCIATNQEHLRAVHLWNGLGLGLVFDDMFYSARLGVAKPSPEFFEAVRSRIGPQNEAPIVIDDSPAVVRAAAAFGWEPILFGSIGDVRNHAWFAERLRQGGPDRIAQSSRLP